jgi:hypothetical protein
LNARLDPNRFLKDVTMIRCLVAVLAVVASVSPTFSLQASSAEGAPSGQPESGAPRPVLVELFTSQGCYSCPPADRLLSRLGRESGGNVVPLAFHVDFWNTLGWRDPFSSSTWSRRQAAYVRALRLDSGYTPQVVVHGLAEAVGSDEKRILAAIATAASRPAAELSLTLEPGSSDVTARVQVEIPEPLREREWDLMLAVYETGLVTAVESGENKGRELRNDYVVRSLRRERLKKNDSSVSEVSSKLPLERDWNRSQLGVAAFLQDRKSLEIGGVAAEPIGDR